MPGNPVRGTPPSGRAGQPRYTLSLPKAFVMALAIEAAFLLSLGYIDFRKAIREPEIRETPRPVTLEPAIEKPREPPPEPEPRPAQPRPKQPSARAEPAEEKPPPRAATPIPASSAAPAPEAADAVPNLPAGNDAPQPPAPAAAAPASPAPAAAAPATPSSPATEPAAPSGPRDSAALADRAACMNALVAAYPREARRAGIEGSLTALVSVAASGRATRVEIVRAKPRRVFDRALSEVLMSAACRFTPAAADYQALIPFEYRLDGESEE